MKYLLTLLMLVTLVSCDKDKQEEPTQTDIEKQYNEIKAAEEKKKMAAVVKANNEKPLKAERWHYGIQQYTWVSVAYQTKKMTRPEHDQMIRAVDDWMDLKTDKKPYYGNPNEIPSMWKEMGFSQARIAKKLKFIAPEANPHLEK